MLERIIQSFFSAIIGALAALAVVFHSGDTGSKFDELEVENLTVTEKMVLRHPETDKDSVVIEAGSVMAANKVVSTQFLASQVAASVIVGNKLLTTPDNIAETPVYDWRFFTELNSDPGCGGELLIRSPRGWNGVGKTLDEGSVVRIGYDSHDNAQIFTFNQATKDAVPVAMERPRWRRAAEHPNRNDLPQGREHHAAGQTPPGARSIPPPNLHASPESPRSLPTDSSSPFAIPNGAPVLSAPIPPARTPPARESATATVPAEPPR